MEYLRKLILAFLYRESAFMHLLPSVENTDIPLYMYIMIFLYLHRNKYRNTAIYVLSMYFVQCRKAYS